MLKLIDDGTLDTVFYCTICRTPIRTHPDGAVDETGESDMHDDERIEVGRALAEDHECIRLTPEVMTCPRS